MGYAEVRSGREFCLIHYVENTGSVEKSKLTSIVFPRFSRMTLDAA